MSINLDGCTRMVLLIGRWAVKIPRLNYGWTFFLRGLLCNMQEVAFSRTGWPELCPILWRVPGGFLSVMARARPLTDQEWHDADIEAFRETPSYKVPVELKRDSFGILGGRLVAVDYGS